MSCKIIRDRKGEIHTVYTEAGKQSLLFDKLKLVLPTSNVAYAVYLKTKEKTNLPDPTYESSLPFVTDALREPSKYDSIIKEAEFDLAGETLANNLASFLVDDLGFSLELIDSLKDEDGNVLPIAAKVRTGQKIVQLIKGKATTQELSEEVAHLTVELLRDNDTALYKSMYKLITNYQIFDQISNPESFYYKQYNGDMDMLKREAIGKVIAMHIMGAKVNRSEEFTAQENVGLIGRIKRWWDKVVAWLKNTFGKKLNDPYVRASELIVQKSLQDYLVKKSKFEGKLTDAVFKEDVAFYAAEETMDPRAKTLQKLDDVAKDYIIDEKAVTENNPEWQKLTEDEYITRYYNQRLNKHLLHRTSDAVTLYNMKKYGHIQRTKEEEQYFKTISEIRMKGGTMFHNTLQDLANYFTKKSTKTPQTILAESGLSVSHFTELQSLVRNLLSHARATQNTIDKNKNFAFRAEQFVVNESKQSGGTIDVLILYSDNTASIYDYKFKTPSTLNKAQARKVAGGYKILKDFYADSIDQYDIQISDYKETLIKKYGVKDIRESRIIPGSVVYKYNKEGIPTGIIDDLQIGGPFLNKYEKNEARKRRLEHESKSYRSFLDPIPVAGERPRDSKGKVITSLEKLILLENKRLQQLKAELNEADYKQSQILKKRIQDSQLIIRKMQVNYDIGTALREMNNTINRLQNLGEPEFIDGKANTKFIDDTELVATYKDLKYYQTYLGQNEYLNFLEKYDKKRYETLKKEIEVTSRVNRTLSAIQEQLLTRAKDRAKSRGILSLDSFNTPTDWVTKNFVSLARHNNPFIRYLHDIVNTNHTQINKISKDLAVEIEELEQELTTYGATQGVYGPNVYDFLIDQKRMRLHSKYKPEFGVDREKALNKARVDEAGKREGIQWIKKYYQIDLEKYNKFYEKWKANAFRAIEATNQSAREKERKKTAWEKRWDLKNHDSAWLNARNLKPTGLATISGAAVEYLSEDYKRIQAVPALRNFYDYHRNLMWKVSHIFGKDLGSGFIANVHKDVIDTWVQDGFSASKMSESVMDLLQVREHDLSLQMTDTNGEYIRHVPRLFVRELINKKTGKIDRTLKSKELGKNLYLIAVAAHQYKFNVEAIPQISVLEALLNDKIVQEQVLDKKGDLVMETLQRAQVIPKSTTAETFNEFVDMEIYGRNMSTKDALMWGTNVSRNKSILALKNFASITALGLKIPVAIGAYGAGKAGLRIQASKGLFYNQKQLNKAYKMVMAFDPKVRAVMEYFDFSLIDLRQRRGDLLATSKRAKYMQHDRWFEFLARADNRLDALLAVSMAQNYGIHPETGKLERMQDLPEGTESLLDTIEMEEVKNWSKTSVKDRYKVKVKGISLDIKNKQEFDNYRSFKAKVRAQSTSVKGTMDQDDKMLIHSGMFGKLMMHYRSWLPGLALERYGNLRYDYIMDHYNEGTWKSLFANVGKEKAFETIEDGIKAEIAFHLTAKQVGADIVKIGLDIVTFGYGPNFNIKQEIAEGQFNKFLANRFGEAKFMKGEEGSKRLIQKGDTEYEIEFKKFLELKRANIRAALSEVRAVILLMLSIMALGGDWDDDGDIDIRETWAGRQLHRYLNRIYREVAFFIDWREFVGSPRSTGVPLISMGGQFIKWVDNSFDELTDSVFGEDDSPDKTPVGYYTFKFLPGLASFVSYFEIYPQYKQMEH